MTNSSRPVMLLTLILFYSVLSVFYSSYGSSINDYNDLDINVDSNGVYDYEALQDGDVNKRGFVGFINNLNTGFKESPIWLNLIFFIPISLFLGYLIIVAWINAG